MPSSALTTDTVNDTDQLGPARFEGISFPLALETQDEDQRRSASR